MIDQYWTIGAVTEQGDGLNELSKNFHYIISDFIRAATNIGVARPGTTKHHPDVMQTGSGFGLFKRSNCVEHRPYHL